MKVKYKKSVNSLYIYLYGELDEYSAVTTKKELDAIIENNSIVNKVVFDMSGLTFMDSTGIGMFLGRYKKITTYKIPVFITGVSGSIEKIFEISGLFRLMPKI